MSEHILICIGIKLGAHSIHRDDCSTAEDTFVHTVAMDVILDNDTRWNVRPVGWVRSREPYILTTEVLIVSCEADGVSRPVERLPQVLANRLWANGRRWLQLNRVNLRHA